MSDAPTFEPVDAARLDLLLPLVRRYYAFDSLPFDETEVSGGFRRLASDNRLGAAWLVRQEGAVVGYVVVTYGFDVEVGGRQATLTELYVEPDARRAGVGRRTIAFVETFLEARGVGALELQVSRTNAEARAFYEEMGFVAHDRIPLTKRFAAPSPRREPVLDSVDHASLGTNDLERARRFYDAALAPLGFRSEPTAPYEIGWFRTADTHHRRSFGLFVGFEDESKRRPVTPSAGFHIAFRAPSRAVVDAFYEAALAAGGRDFGAPGLRPVYHADYYGAFVLDPDGHHVEVVCHEPE